MTHEARDRRAFLRGTREQGGNIFTLCDKHWDAHYADILNGTQMTGGAMSEPDKDAYVKAVAEVMWKVRRRAEALMAAMGRRDDT